MDLGILPVVPGSFVEDNVINGFNNTIINYLRSHTDFRNVISLKTIDKNDVVIVKVKIKKMTQWNFVFQIQAAKTV